ncbi:PLP-dependent aminotransferase family protein [Chryseobacterium nematophagum]|uniref:PLP-dependent aminotransferase family protein n=1 Tax=Chryseobacterium nematophagum TaxID=2305228 RepID=A0A3M7LDL3_9FLAO|nr:PLP-dependent aminotransferase family protein [Chryseobacterium nematophagum]RMZ60134.1 PLP-dependent aminotransferase family protein [Chryseobacterium nematophagum]
MKKEFIYSEITNQIADQIQKGILKAGDKLPSVRKLCQDHQISMNTAKRVYLELESRSLIDSRPQSGYYVSKPILINLPLPEVSQPSLIANTDEPNELISKVYENMGKKGLTIFSIGIPAGDLLPQAKLKKEIINATRELREGGTGYEELQGNIKLRRMIAVRSLQWGGNFTANDLVTTNGGINALSFCLMALGKFGDTIAIESPCYPGILQLANGLGLKVLELPTHPTTGIEIDTLKKVIHKINICLLIPNFSSPLGSCMPDENKKEVVKLLAENNIPLIEDDVYGDLYFGTNRPKCCKSFDTEGNVLYCSSISKTLAPGYRVGWIAPGKYKDKILKLKLLHSTSSISIVNEAVANFLKFGRYEKHLFQLRKALQDNCQNYIKTIAEFFPEGTKTTRPQGGLSLWVEFDKKIPTVELYDLAIKQNISIAPGRMFTLQNQFENCIRLCIGLPWSDEIKLKLKQIGTLAKTI